MQCKPRNSKSTRTQLEFGIGKRKETLSEECGLGWDFLVGGGLDWVGLGSGFGFAMDRTSDWRCRRYVLKKARTMMMAPSRIDSATTGNTASIFWSEKHTHTEKDPNETTNVKVKRFYTRMERAGFRRCTRGLLSHCPPHLHLVFLVWNLHCVWCYGKIDGEIIIIIKKKREGIIDFSYWNCTVLLI